MNGSCDISSAAQCLRFQYREFGYVEIPLCKDPLAVVVNEQCPITDLTDQQLRDIVNRNITNWKELGGPDRQIVLIVPGENTAAYRNFSRLAMNGNEMQNRFPTYLVQWIDGDMKPGAVEHPELL